MKTMKIGLMVIKISSTSTKPILESIMTARRGVQKKYTINKVKRVVWLRTCTILLSYFLNKQNICSHVYTIQQTLQKYIHYLKCNLYNN